MEGIAGLEMEVIKLNKSAWVKAKRLDNWQKSSAYKEVGEEKEWIKVYS